MSKTQRKSDCFVWTDDEVELLLQVTKDYKASKSMENVDWESCQTKYSDILNLFNEQYPPPEDAEKLAKEYPHKKEELTKIMLTSKLKAIRAKFRKAVDTGRRSGHGRVVLLYFELCEEVWGGSPATNTIPSGIETVELDQDDTSNSTVCSFNESSASSVVSTLEQDLSDIAELSEAEVSKESSSVKERRDLLNVKLKGYKQEKLKRKLPIDSQLLAVAHDELQVKKQLLDKMEKMDKECSSHLNKLTSNMEKLTGCIAEGFSMLRQIMHPPFSQYMPPASYPSMHSGYSNVINPTVPTHRPDSPSPQFSYTHALFSDIDNNDTL